MYGDSAEDKGVVINEFRYLAGVTDLKPVCVLFTYFKPVCGFTSCGLGEGS
jgi:hypothetical protein